MEDPNLTLLKYSDSRYQIRADDNVNNWAAVEISKEGEDYEITLTPRLVEKYSPHTIDKVKLDPNRLEFFAGYLMDCLGNELNFETCNHLLKGKMQTGGMRKPDKYERGLILKIRNWAKTSLLKEK